MYEHVEIRDAKTRVFPFTVGDATPRWGALYIGSYEPPLDGVSEIFRAWFSQAPNGSALHGAACDWYSSNPNGYLNWTFGEETDEPGSCNLGADAGTLYLNFETRCSPDVFSGRCDDAQRQKQDRSYRFFIDRQPAN